MSSFLPDGEGVIDDKAPARKVIAYLMALIAVVIVSTVAFLNFFGMLGPHEASAAPSRPGSSLEMKVDQIREELHAVKKDIGDVRVEQGNQSGDIRVIKRQLGIDGLGAPPRGGRSP